jgi:hypothetical protein
MLRVMSSFADCRTFLLRARWVRGMAVLLLLTVVASGFPRWEVHSHAVADHHQAHAALSADHDDHATPASVDPEQLVLHVHDSACLTAVPCQVDDIALIQSLPPSWVLPFQSDQAAYAAGPPPDRPPIA